MNWFEYGPLGKGNMHLTFDFFSQIRPARKELDEPKLKSLKVEKILRGSLDFIPSPSPSVKIQIMGGKVCLRCEGLGKSSKYALNSQLQALQILTNDDEVEN